MFRYYTITLSIEAHSYICQQEEGKEVGKGKGIHENGVQKNKITSQFQLMRQSENIQSFPNPCTLCCIGTLEASGRLRLFN